MNQKVHTLLTECYFQIFCKQTFLANLYWREKRFKIIDIKFKFKIVLQIQPSEFAKEADSEKMWIMFETYGGKW